MPVEDIIVEHITVVLFFHHLGIRVIDTCPIVSKHPINKNRNLSALTFVNDAFPFNLEIELIKRDQRANSFVVPARGAYIAGRTTFSSYWMILYGHRFHP